MNARGYGAGCGGLPKRVLGPKEDGYDGRFLGEAGGHVEHLLTLMKPRRSTCVDAWPR